MSGKSFLCFFLIFASVMFGANKVCAVGISNDSDILSKPILDTVGGKPIPNSSPEQLYPEDVQSYYNLTEYTLSSENGTLPSNVITKYYINENGQIEKKYYIFNLKKTVFGEGNTSIVYGTGANAVSVNYSNTSYETEYTAYSKDMGTVIGTTSKTKLFGGAALNNTADTEINLKNVLFKNNSATLVFETNQSGSYHGDFFGGAVYNAGKISEISGDFVNNTLNYTLVKTAGSSYGGALGGAISNDGQIDNINAAFIDNQVNVTSAQSGDSSGGAIFNTGTIGNISGIFAGNAAKVNGTYSEAVGGGISNLGKIDNIDAVFIGNYSESPNYYTYGGAIYNNGTIYNLKGVFIGNYVCSASINGGALYNGTDGTISELSGIFINNKGFFEGRQSGGNGGALYNIGNIGNIYADFIGNSIYGSQNLLGGALANSGNIDSITGDFINNSLYTTYNGVFGGALSNYGQIQSVNADFIGNNATGDNADGGALSNFEQIVYINGDFINNQARSTGDIYYSSYGGAIYNGENAHIGRIKGNFIGNHADGGAYGNGGAIENFYHSQIYNINGDFIGNYTTAVTYSSSGGAIDNRGRIGITDGSFIGNYTFSPVRGSGGAICISEERAETTIVAENKDVIFSGNFTATTKNSDGTFADKIPNAIHISDGTLIFRSSDDKKIIFYDPITSNAKKGTIEMGNGLLVLNADMSRYTGKVEVTGGTIKIGENGTYFNPSNTYLNRDAVLDFQNRKIDSANLGNLTLSPNYNVYINLDASLAGTGAMDYLNVSGTNGKGSLYIDSVSIITDMDDDTTLRDLDFTNTTSIYTYLSATAEICMTTNNVYGLSKLDKNTLRFQKLEKLGGIAEALSYNLSGSEYFITESTENLQAWSQKYGSILKSKYLNVHGNMNAMNGGENAGILTYNGKKLSIDDVGKFRFEETTVNNPNAFAIKNTDGKTTYYTTENSTGWSNFKTESETGTASGGAVYNGGTFSTKNTNYINNTASGRGATGGAVSNGSTANEISANFISNSAVAVSNSSYPTAEGGAIYNSGTIKKISGNYINNTAEAESLNSYGTAKGGAISTKNGRIDEIVNSNFINNTAKATSKSGYANAKGGAIYSYGTNLTISADNGTSLFTGNKTVAITNKGSDKEETVTNDNAVYMDSYGSTLTLKAKNDGVIQFDDKIDGNGGYNVAVTGDETGKVIVNNKIQNAYITLEKTNLVLGNDEVLNESQSLTLNSGTLSMVNGKVGAMHVYEFSVNGTTNLEVDVDLQAKTMDNITADYYPEIEDAKLNVSSLNLLNDANQDIIKIQFAPSEYADIVAYTGKNPIALTPIYKYGVSYDESSGMFAFDRVTAGIDSGNQSDNFNPSVLAPSVAAQSGAYTSQLQAYNYAFQHTDTFMSMSGADRLAVKNANKYALSPTSDATDVGTFSPLFTEINSGGIWYKPYSSFESIPLKNGPKVSNINYGSLIGYDSPLKSLGHGFDRVITGYIGYNGASQRYQGVDAYQNGGLLGGTATFYKGNFFTAATLSVGATAGSATNMYGSEDYSMLVAGIGAKTGYNFEFKDGKYIIQPNLLMSYTFVNTFDYTNSAGLKIKSEPLNAIQVAPGVKFIVNLKNGWQPYLGVNMIWNILDKTRVTADDVRLPEMSIDPYVEYGVGIQKRWADKFTGYAQAMLRNGGRNGVSLTCGLRWAVGKK